MNLKEEFRRRVNAHFRWGALQYQCVDVTDGSHHSPQAVIQGLPYVTVQDVRDGEIDLIGCKRISEKDFLTLERNGCRPRVGDVLLTKDGTIGRAAVVKTAKRFVVLSSLGIVRPDERRIDASFLRYYLESAPGVQQMEGAVQGAALTRLTIVKIKRLDTVIPTLPTQKAIADYLDDKTVAIDALIEKKRKLLELLVEERAALINQAVTKGLDPNVPMKDSGIPWIGEVPAHWEVKQLKHVSPDVTVGIVITPAKYYVDNGVPCPRSLNVAEMRLIEDDLVYISDASNAMLAKSKIYEGDLLCVRSGQPGTTAVVDRRFHGANCIDLIIIRQSRLMDSKFLAYTMNSAAVRVQYMLGATGAIQTHFNVGTARELVVSAPPVSEQHQIAEHLDRKMLRVKKIRDINQQQVDRLQEYRQALITAAVTGQLDIEVAT